MAKTLSLYASCTSPQFDRKSKKKHSRLQNFFLDQCLDRKTDVRTTEYYMALYTQRDRSESGTERRREMVSESQAVVYFLHCDIFFGFLRVY